MIFNGIDFSDYFVVEYIRRQFLPPIEAVTVEVPGRVGNRFVKSKLDEGVVEVDIRIIEKTRLLAQQKARQMAGLLYTTEPKKLILRDTPDSFNLAILDGDMDFEKFLHTGFTTLTFLCPDPSMYDLTETTIVNVQSKTIVNPGTLPSRGILTVKPGTRTNVKITLQNTGEYIHIEDSFIASDTVVIDMEEESVRKNDILIMDKLDINSDFFEIPTGNSTITTTGGTITVKYRRRWLI